VQCSVNSYDVPASVSSVVHELGLLCIWQVLVTIQTRLNEFA